MTKTVCIGGGGGEKMAAAMVAIKYPMLKAKYAAKAAKAANRRGQMLLLMRLLQLRIGGFCLICNNWWMLRCGGIPLTPTHISYGRKLPR